MLNGEVGNTPGLLTVHHPGWNILLPRAQTWVLEHGSGRLVGVLSRAAPCLQVSQYLRASLSGFQEGALYVYKLISHWLLLSGFVSVDFLQHSLVIG